MTVRFDISQKDSALVQQIVERAMQHPKRVLFDGDRMGLTMDIEATHRNGNRLDLARLLAADDFNFWHDVAGIQGMLDRNTGKLTNFFVPRCSAPKKAARGRTSRADKRMVADLASAEN